MAKITDANIEFDAAEIEDMRGYPGVAGPQGPKGDPGPRGEMGPVGERGLRPDIEPIIEEVRRRVLSDLRDLIPPRVDPSSDSRVTPDQFATVDAWLDAVEAGRPGYIPPAMHVNAGNIRDRVLTGDTHITIDGTLDFGGRFIGLGVNCANLRIGGVGKITGCKIAFLASPDKGYDGATGKDAFRGFIPELTRDLESIHLDLAEWQCSPFVHINYAPAPKDFNIEKSKHRLHKLFFRGWCHDAPGGLIVLTQRWGAPGNMVVSSDGTFTGNPAFDIKGKFERIDGRGYGKENFVGRAIVVGGNREEKDPGSRVSSGGLLIEADISDVYNDGYGNADGNETQGIRVEGFDTPSVLIRDTSIRRVRHAGTTNDIAESVQRLKHSPPRPVDNCEGLYSKGPLVGKNLLLEDCDGAGYDSGAITNKGSGPVFMNDVTIRWTRDDWRKVVNRVIRCNNHPDSKYGVTVEGYGDVIAFGPDSERERTLFWSKDGHPETRVDYTILP